MLPADRHSHCALEPRDGGWCRHDLEQLRSRCIVHRSEAKPPALHLIGVGQGTRQSSARRELPGICRPRRCRDETGRQAQHQVGDGHPSCGPVHSCLLLQVLNTGTASARSLREVPAPLSNSRVAAGARAISSSHGETGHASGPRKRRGKATKAVTRPRRPRIDAAIRVSCDSDAGHERRLGPRDRLRLPTTAAHCAVSNPNSDSAGDEPHRRQSHSPSATACPLRHRRCLISIRIARIPVAG